MLPTPEAKLSDSGPDYARANRAGSGGDDLTTTICLTGALLPTPRGSDGAKGGPNQRGSSGDLMLPSAVVQLLPTPTSTDHKASGASQPSTDTHQQGTTLTDATVRQPDRWGDYADAIARWEAVIGRPAPNPTETGPKGSPRLSPAFVEWMMGLPAGHVTDAGLSRVAELKALGNGVVIQQAETAIRYLLDLVDQEIAA